MKKFVRIVAAMLIAVMGIVPIVNACASGETMYVTRDSVEVHTTAQNLASNIMGYLDAGAAVHVQWYTGAWAYVQFTQVNTGAIAQGYVAKQYLSSSK